MSVRAAYHEAGHVIIGLVLGCAACSATLEEQPKVFVEPPPGFLIRDYVLFSLAGYAAALKFAETLGEPVDSLLIASEAASDLADVEKELARLSAKTPSVTLVHLLYEARKLVDAHWSAIDRLARRLFEMKTLTSGQINEAA